jgi:hypothetical protein
MPQQQQALGHGATTGGYTASVWTYQAPTKSWDAASRNSNHCRRQPEAMLIRAVGPTNAAFEVRVLRICWHLQTARNSQTGATMHWQDCSEAGSRKFGLVCMDCSQTCLLAACPTHCDFPSEAPNSVNNHPRLYHVHTACRMVLKTGTWLTSRLDCNCNSRNRNSVCVPGNPSPVWQFFFWLDSAIGHIHGQYLCLCRHPRHQGGTIGTSF